MKLIIIIVIYLLYSIFSAVGKAIKKGVSSPPLTPVTQPRNMAKNQQKQRPAQRKAVGSFGDINKSANVSKNETVLLPDDRLDLPETSRQPIVESEIQEEPKLDSKDLQLEFSQPSVLYQAVVMSEILGEPRAKKPFNFQQGRK